MKSQFAQALNAIERARMIGGPTQGSRAAVEILAGAEGQLLAWQSAMLTPGDDLAQDDEWQSWYEARKQLPRAKREIAALRLAVAAAKLERLI